MKTKILVAALVCGVLVLSLSACNDTPATETEAGTQTILETSGDTTEQETETTEKETTATTETEPETETETEPETEPETETETDPPHTHTYSETWSSDDVNHWHICSCGDIGDSAAHTWDNDKCTVCGYDDVAHATQGLAYALNDDQSSYTLTGIGTAQGTEIRIPRYYNGFPVTAIASDAFGSEEDVNTTLTTVIIPNGVTSIGENAFQNCRSLSSVTIPSSMTSIGKRAFYGCYKLLEVYNLSALPITQHTRDYGYIAVYALDVYTSLDQASKLSLDENGFLIHTEGTVKTVFYIGNGADVSIPNGVTNIGSFAFNDCTVMTSVTIPDSVTGIGNSAFLGCINLARITIPNSVTAINSSAFSGCTGLTSVTLPNGITAIGNYLFEECSSLVEITIPEGVTGIGDWAFAGCINLKSIAIPKTLARINYSAFRRCKSLTSIIIPNGVTEMGSSVFDGCTDMTNIYCEALRPKYIWKDAWLSNCSAAVTWGYQNVTDREDYDYVVYGDTVSLTNYKGSEREITIPTTIDGKTVIAFVDIFYNDQTITKVSIPASVATISPFAFAYCENLTSVTIPNSVTVIGAYAFDHCISLTNITIPSSTTSIGDFAFRYCNSMGSFTVQEGNKRYHSAGNCLIETATKTLIFGTLNCDIPSDGSVTTIGKYAFSEFDLLTSIAIPNSVTNIEEYSFAWCDTLTTIIYNGTMAQWEAIEKGDRWNYSTGDYTIICTDGTISK